MHGRISSKPKLTRVLIPKIHVLFLQSVVNLHICDSIKFIHDEPILKFSKHENIIPISCILMLLVKIKERELALLLATDKGDHLVSRAWPLEKERPLWCVGANGFNFGYCVPLEMMVAWSSF
jgi:hypothetical protein